MRGSKILLLKRNEGASSFHGYWCGPTGKLEEGESPKQAIIRECLEEVGIKINPEFGTAIVVKTSHFKHPELVWKDISLFFVAKDFEGEPVNLEPNKHDLISWFDVNALPEPMMPVVKFGIEQYIRGQPYGEFGY